MDNNDAVFNVQELPFEDDILPDSSYIEEPVDDQMMDPFDQCSVCSDITDFLKLTDAMVDEINDDILSLARGKGSELGTGGMITKLNAAKICMDCGCTMVIANGERGEVLYDILDGKEVGTRFSRG